MIENGGEHGRRCACDHRIAPESHFQGVLNGERQGGSDVDADVTATRQWYLGLMSRMACDRVATRIVTR